MDKVLVRMRLFRLHGNCGLGCHWPFLLVDQFGCFDYVAVFLRLQMKTTECSRLPYSKFGDSSTTPPLGCRAVVPQQPLIVVFRIANAEERVENEIRAAEIQSPFLYPRKTNNNKTR